MFKSKFLSIALALVLGLTGFTLLPQISAQTTQPALLRQVFQISNNGTSVGTVKIEATALELRFVITRPNQPQHVFRQIFQTRTLIGEVAGQTIFAIDFNPAIPVVSGHPQTIKSAFLEDMPFLQSVGAHTSLTRLPILVFQVAATPAVTQEDFSSLIPLQAEAASTGEVTFQATAPLSNCYATADALVTECEDGFPTGTWGLCSLSQAKQIAECNRSFIRP